MEKKKSLWDRKLSDGTSFVVYFVAFGVVLWMATSISDLPSEIEPYARYSFLGLLGLFLAAVFVRAIKQSRITAKQAYGHTRDGLIGFAKVVGGLFIGLVVIVVAMWLYEGFGNFLREHTTGVIIGLLIIIILMLSERK